MRCEAAKPIAEKPASIEKKVDGSRKAAIVSLPAASRPGSSVTCKWAPPIVRPKASALPPPGAATLLAERVKDVQPSRLPPKLSVSSVVARAAPERVAIARINPADTVFLDTVIVAIPSLRVRRSVRTCRLYERQEQDLGLNSIQYQ